MWQWLEGYVHGALEAFSLVELLLCNNTTIISEKTYKSSKYKTALNSITKLSVVIINFSYRVQIEFFKYKQFTSRTFINYDTFFLIRYTLQTLLDIEGYTARQAIFKTNQMPRKLTK